jgi:N-acetylglucosamine repressor
MQKATRQYLKEHNSRLVLKTIYHSNAISRADIARTTHLTRTTVSDIVNELIEEGLLEEAGVGTSMGGKPPILLNMLDDARSLVCLDLSNDEFQGALVNLRGKILRREAFHSDCLESETALNCVYSLLDSLIPSASSPVIGIGIGTPGLIDTVNGVVRQAVNLGWKDLPLKHLLEIRYGLPIYIANDSHVAALAEYTFGQEDHTDNLVVIKVGRGIGSGIVMSGQIHYGDSFNAGEIGHLTVVEDGSRCTCGNYGCLETVSSSRAILSQARKVFPERTDLSFDDVLEAYQAGDEAIGNIIHKAGAYLGASIANLIGILNIHKIVISGSLVGFGPPLLAAANSIIQSKVLPAMANETEISFSRLGSDNVILGASALVLSQEYGLP